MGQKVQLVVGVVLILCGTACILGALGAGVYVMHSPKVGLTLKELKDLPDWVPVLLILPAAQGFLFVLLGTVVAIWPSRTSSLPPAVGSGG